MLRHHSWIVYIVRERKHCPQTQFLTKQEALIVPPILPLSLSMSSYSNELDHTSDAAETHDPGQDSLLPSYSLFSFYQPHHNIVCCPSKQTSDLFFKFSVGFLQKLLPIFQHRSIPPRSVLSLATFIIRTPSMPAAMPNFTHTTQLRKQGNHAFPCNNDGAPSQHVG